MKTERNVRRVLEQLGGRHQLHPGRQTLFVLCLYSRRLHACAEGLALEPQFEPRLDLDGIRTGLKQRATAAVSLRSRLTVRNLDAHPVIGKCRRQNQHVGQQGLSNPERHGGALCAHGEGGTCRLL